MAEAVSGVSCPAVERKGFAIRHFDVESFLSVAFGSHIKKIYDFTLDNTKTVPKLYSFSKKTASNLHRTFIFIHSARI
jgi:hypothetical protein